MYELKGEEWDGLGMWRAWVRIGGSEDLCGETIVKETTGET